MISKLKFLKLDKRIFNIIKSGLTTGFVKIIISLINIFIVPLTLNYLGPIQYGIWMAVSTILSLITFTDFGLGNGLINFLSKANALNDDELANKSINSTFFILVGISTLLLILMILIGLHLNYASLLNINDVNLTDKTNLTAIVIIVIFIIGLPFGIFQRIEEGYQKGYIFQIFQFIGYLISLLLLFFSIKNKMGLPYLVASYSLGPFISNIINGIYLFNFQDKRFKISFKYFNYELSLKIIKSGLLFFILGIFTFLGNTTDNIIIARNLGLESITLYELVRKLFLFSMFTQYLIYPLWPAFGEAIESKDFIWVKKTIEKSLLITIIIGILSALPIVFWSDLIILKWTGREIKVDNFLLFGFLIYIITANYGGVMSTFLNSGPLISKQVVFIILSSLLSLILKYFFSIKFGISGVIWGTVLGYSIFFIFPSYILIRNYLQNEINEKT